MVLIGFGYFSSFWASLVVLALVGISGKNKIFIYHWFIFFYQFLDLFYNYSNYYFLLFFRGIRHFQYLQNNFSPGESPQNGTQPGSLLDIFPILDMSPYFFHIPFISFQKNAVGHNGNDWEIFRFHLFFVNSLRYFGN